MSTRSCSWRKRCSRAIEPVAVRKSMGGFRGSKLSQGSCAVSIEAWLDARFHSIGRPVLSNERRASGRQHRVVGDAWRRLGSTVAATGLTMAATGTSHAQSQSDPKRAMAQALFEQGRSDFGKHEYHRACQKLAESRKLDSAPGTLLNLALCYEVEGKLASAWAEYNVVAAVAEKTGDVERGKIAAERIRILAPRLSHIVIHVPPESRLLDITISVDGVTLGPGAWETPLPADPGVHVVSAKAKDRVEWTHQVTISKDAELCSISIPVLTIPERPSTPRPAGLSPVRAIGLGALGVGAASLIAGTYFGLRARASWQDRNRHCSSGVCDSLAVESWRDAKRFSTAADGAFALGVVAAGAAAYLLLVPIQPVAKSHRLELSATASGLSIRLGGPL